MDTSLIVAVILGLAGVVVILIAIQKISTLTKIIENLSSDLPGTYMTAKELASELTSAFEVASQKQLDATAKVTAALSEAATGLTGGLESASQKQLTAIEKITGTLSEAAVGLTSGSQTLATKLQSVFSGHAAEVQNALQGVGSGWKDQIAGALTDHAQKVNAANQQVADQLEKIAALEKEITQILKLQEATETTLKQIAASEAFSATLTSLTKHLEASDKLLAEAAKPRTIRLVEREGEGAPVA